MTPQWIGIDYVFRAADERRWAEVDLGELHVELQVEIAEDMAPKRRGQLSEGQLARRKENAARRRTAAIAAGGKT